MKPKSYISNRKADKYTFLLMLASFLLVTVPKTVFQVDFELDIPTLVEIFQNQNWFGLIEFVLPFIAIITRISDKVKQGFSWDEVLGRITRSQNFWVKLGCVILGAITLMGVVFPENAVIDLFDVWTGGNLGRAITVTVAVFLNPIIIRFIDKGTPPPVSA